MSAEAYQILLRKKNEKKLSYINNRARGIWNFLQSRSESLTLDRMVYELNLIHLKSSIPTLQSFTPTWMRDAEICEDTDKEDTP